MKARIGSGLLRLSISVGLLAVLAFVVVDTRELVRAISRMQLPVLLLAVMLTAADRVFMAYKWRLLLTARGVAISLWVAVRAYFATSLAGLLLPVTVGADAIRVLAVRRYGMLDVAASVVVERVLGAIAMATVALMSCALLALRLTGMAVRPLMLTLVAVAVLGVAGFLLSFPLASRWASTGGRGLAAQLGKIAGSYAAYRRHFATLAVFYALSVGESLMPVLITYVVAIGLGLDLPLTLFVATVPIAFTIARLPISLGGFGVLEVSFVYLASLLGVSATSALSIMLVADGALFIALAPAALDVRMLSLRHEAS